MGLSAPGTSGGSDRVLRLVIPSDARFVRKVRKELIAFARRHRVASSDLDTLLLAVGEALANAVEHAGSAHDIEVQCRVDDREIVATIIDSGRGVGRTLADDIIAPLPEPMAEGGRGIPIMQRCTDMFSIRSLPGGGTGVVLGLLRHIQENHAAS
ncbi:MAG TPA: ATP-binding protein [Candidatus Tyrphobacter sp.]